MQARAIRPKHLYLGQILRCIDKTTDMDVEALAQVPHDVEGRNLFSLVRGEREPLAQEQHGRPIIHVKKTNIGI